MPYSASDFQQIANNWLKSSAGQSEVRKLKKDTINGNASSSGFRGNGKGLYTKSDMERMANELKSIVFNEIINAGIRSYRIDYIKVQPPTETLTGDYKVEIVFPEDTLKRKSLWTGGDFNGGYTSDGIYDIIGLFSNGYHANKQVWGYWIGHENSSNGVGSRISREPNAFISRAVSIFKSKYPDGDITVSYPAQWGGTF